MKETLPTSLCEAIDALRRRLRERLAPRSLAGVCPAARPLALAALLDTRPAVVVVPAARDAEELLAGLRLLAPGLACATLPAEAFEAYQDHPPPLGATAAAAAALLALGESAVQVLVVPARVLPFPLPAPAALRLRCTALEQGQRLDPRELAAALVEAGYRRSEVVEEAGEFAIRGQVIDVGMIDEFFRVLLDVDRIEKLNRLDPGTQRSGEEVECVLVAPLRLHASGMAERLRLADLLDGC
ncbi:MAG: hypothetical protein V1750_04410, partial [Acidobacteriota bacterium]